VTAARIGGRALSSGLTAAATFPLSPVTTDGSGWAWRAPHLSPWRPRPDPAVEARARGSRRLLHSLSPRCWRTPASGRGVPLLSLRVQDLQWQCAWRHGQRARLPPHQ
jgi:hypothetical protein